MPEHIERLWRAAGGDIRMIVCTHSHADHSPGARPLQALCKSSRRSSACPRRRPRARRASSRPTACWRTARTLALRAAACATRLKAIHTPGHAANHLCLVLLEDGLLFSGDHILNGSTTVVDPPDGDMTAYLDSLDPLTRCLRRIGIEFILPAHGYVLGFAPQAIAQLKAHRLQREAKIVAAMRARARRARWTTGCSSPTPTCRRACGRWPSARCWRTCSASRRCNWPPEQCAAKLDRQPKGDGMEAHDPREHRKITAYPVEFSGSGGEYFRVWIVNVLLTVVTLGLYTPLARRRTAQYFYGHTLVAGSPLEFTAQTRRMLFGFLLFVALYAALKIAEHTGQDRVVMVMLLGGALLAPYFWASAMRFRLSATRWRGVRLQFTAGWGEVYRPACRPSLALVWLGGLAQIEAPVVDSGKGSGNRTLAVGVAMAAALISVFCVIRLEYNYKSLPVGRGRIGGQAGRWKPVFGDFVRIWLATVGVFLAVVLLVALAAGLTAAGRWRS